MDELLTIVKIKKYDKKNNWLVTLSNNQEIKLNSDILLKYQINKNIQFSYDEIQQIIKEQRLIDVKLNAYKFVSYKPRTCKQIQQKLYSKNFTKDEIVYALRFLEDFNLIDDISYAKTFIPEYTQRKKCGKNKVIAELLHRGIDKDTAEKLTKDYFDTINPVENAMVTANKKLKMIRNKPLQKQKELLIYHLKRNGFNWEIIKKILTEFKL